MEGNTGKGKGEEIFKELADYMIDMVIAEASKEIADNIISQVEAVLCEKYGYVGKRNFMYMKIIENLENKMSEDGVNVE